MNGSYAIPTRAKRGEAAERGRLGEPADFASSSPRERLARAGTAGRDERSSPAEGQDSGDEENAGDGSNPAEANGETGSTATQGGARSRGAASGPLGRDDPAAENRGEHGVAPVTEHSASAAEAATPAVASPGEASGRPGGLTPPSAATQGAARTMRPAAPEAENRAAPPPGAGTEADQTPPPPAPGVGVAALRRELAQKHWPGPGMVNTAELVKQAPRDADASGGAAAEPLSVRVEIAPSPWAQDKTLVRVSLKARSAPLPKRPPANLVFAIDVSQSMAGPNRLPLVQEGIRLLAERLRPEDRVAVVTYAASAKELLPGIPLGENALELRNCLGALEAAGQTNGDEGLRLAYAAARRGRVESGLNVVVLCTDGNFNLGETNEAVLAGLAAQAAEEGIRLSVFGFGRSDRNDLRLELLATQGGGRSCYVNTREEAERLLATQIDGLLEPAARDVTLTVKFHPERVATSVRTDGGAEGAAGGTVAELLPGRSAEALYEISLPPGPADVDAPLAGLEVSYRLPGLPGLQRRTVSLSAARQEWTDTDRSFRFAVAWAELARILRGERAAAGADLDRLEAWVEGHLPDDVGGYRSELLDNVAAARIAAAGRY
jgi:Ca-activated chloride channel family protein